MEKFEELFKDMDWRHSSLLSASILQKGFRVYNFWLFCVKSLFFSSFFFFFFSSPVCLVCFHLGKKKKKRNLNSNCMEEAWEFGRALHI